jgi:hypothetical protein
MQNKLKTNENWYLIERMIMTYVKRYHDKSMSVMMCVLYCSI